MNLVEFSEYLVSGLVDNADLVKVKDFSTDEEHTIEILVSEDDMGRVIGKGGKIAQSIKTLIQAKAYNEGIDNIKINIDSF
ncbi:MAG: KH domain-containing protein [Clostridia bacterium]